MKMKKGLQEILDKYNLNKDDAEDMINLVVELLEFDIQDTEENTPNATHSIAKMKLAISQVQNLHELFKIDPDVEWIMDEFGMDEEEVMELVGDCGLTAEEIKHKFKRGDVNYFGSHREAFDWCHEEEDREELLDLLWNDQSKFEDGNYFEYNGTHIYFKDMY